MQCTIEFEQLAASEQHMALDNILGQSISSLPLESILLVAHLPEGGRTALSILARRRFGGRRARPFTRTMRQAVQVAIDTAHALLFEGRHARKGQVDLAEVLFAVPVVLDDQRVWGALVAIGQLPGPYAPVIQALEEHARCVAAIVATNSRAFSPPQDVVTRHLPTTLPTQLPTRLPARTELPFGMREDVVLHELRTPLAAAGYALEKLAATGAGSADPDRMVSQLLDTAYLAVEEAQSILRWSGQLRAISEEGASLSLIPLSVREVVERALALLPAAAARVVLAVADDLPAVVADRRGLTQVLTNLLENAVKYAPPSAAIRVVAGPHAPDRMLVAITSAGSGIPLGTQRTMFQPYVRGAQSDDLTSKGLGLSIARYFVTAMGGEIWVESDGSSSTTLSLTLPLAYPVVSAGVM